MRAVWPIETNCPPLSVNPATLDEFPFILDDFIYETLEETNSAGIVWLPKPHLAAYVSIFQNTDFTIYFNTVFYHLALTGTLISVAIVAYAFSRIEWPGRNIVFFLMLSTMMIPPQALIVPQYVLTNCVGGYIQSIIIPGFSPVVQLWFSCYDNPWRKSQKNWMNPRLLTAHLMFRSFGK